MDKLPAKRARAPLARGRRLFFAALLVLTLFWGLLAGLWLLGSPELSGQPSALRALLRAYGRGEPYLVPKLDTSRASCDAVDLGYGGVDGC